MQAWQVTILGTLAERTALSSPTPEAGQVRVKVAAVGLNFADLLMAEGRYQERPALPFIPGMEFAGTVDAIGLDTDLPLGLRVAGFASHGALAEYITAPAGHLIPLPDNMSFQQAAAFQIAYGTSHLALSHKARLQPGETLLVFGAAGGVGLTAVEIGKRIGARVIACACRPEGRLLTIGFASGQVPEIHANHLLVKNLSVMGLYWGGYLTFAPHILTDSLRTLFQWFAEGGLRPHISHEVPFADYPKGLELLRTRHATGKVVITL